MIEIIRIPNAPQDRCWRVNLHCGLRSYHANGATPEQAMQAINRDKEQAR